MRNAIAVVSGLGRKYHSKPMPHHDILANLHGTGELVFIKCPQGAPKASDLPEIEYFFNLHATATALERQKRNRKKGREVSENSRVEAPEVAVEMEKPMEARLIYDASDAFHVTHPKAFQNLGGDLVARIDKAFYGKDFSKLKGVIAYPASKGPYRFIAIARRSGEAKDIIHEVPSYDQGSGEGQSALWYPNQWHPARVTGKRYAVPSKKFMSAEAPEGMAYVPIEGLPHGEIREDVAYMIIACCADSFFPKDD
jgi:hypothetical protein